MKALDGVRYILRQPETQHRGEGLKTPSTTGSRVGWMTAITAGLVSLTLAQQTTPQPTPPTLTGTQSISLPLASIGKAVGWKIDSEDYRLNVPAAAAGRVTSLEVYSPEINRNDYANARNRNSYYGDELYGKTATLKTTFQVSNSANEVLFNQTFGESTRHNSVQLLNTALTQGFYPFAISSDGNGKNSFQIRASAGVRVEASRFIVNARGQFNQDQLVAFVDLGSNAVGKTVELSNYDADGSKEMILTLVDPKGVRVPLNISPDTGWASNQIKVTSANVGTWKILARILPTTKQFSNSVAFRFRLDNQPLFGRIPGFGLPAGAVIQPAKPKGKLLVTSSALSCAQTTPFNSSFSLDGTTYTTPANLELTPGDYTITPQNVNGSSVQPITITVKNAETSKANITYNVITNIKLEPQNVSLENGESTTFTASVSTEFPSAIPSSISLELPTGVSTKDATQATGTIETGKPLVLNVNATGNQTINNANVVARTCEATANAVISVASPAKIALTKTVDKTEVKTGENVNFTIIVSNTGGSTARNVQLTDTLPAGLTGEAINSSFDLKAGESQTFTLPASVTATQSGTIINTAQTLWNSQTLVASASVKLVVPPPTPPTPEPAKLELSKTVDSSNVSPNDTVNYTITVKNTGGSSAENIKLEDVLPTGLSGKNLDQTFNLGAGESKTFTLPASVVATESGDITNTASVRWDSVLLFADATVHLVVPEPAKLTLTKTVDQQKVNPNDIVNFTITVANTGGSSAKNIQLEDILPSGLFGSNLSKTFSLPAGESKIFSVQARVTATESGEITNTATLNWNDTNLAAHASVFLTVPGPAKLELTKTVDRDLVQPGDTATFTVKVTNVGGSVAKRVKLKDILPAGLKGKNLNQTFELEIGETKTFSIETIVTADTAQTITNTATVNWNGTVLDATASIRIVLPAKLELTKTVDRDLVQPGETATFTIKVSNTGGSTAERIKLEDILPAGLNGTNINTSFDLAAGETKTFTVPTTVTANTAQTITNTATLIWNGSSLNANAKVRIVLPAKLTLTKTVDRENVQPNDTVNFTITVTNTGGSNAENIKLEDVLPAGLTGNDLSSSFNLSATESKTFNLPAQVTKNTNGTIVNTAVVNWNGSRLTADAMVKVTVPEVVVVPPTPAVPASLSLTKTVDRSTVQPGEIVNFTITVTNNGGSSAENINLIDLLPSGLSGAMTNEIFNLGVGETKTILVPTRVTATTAGTITNTAEVFWNGVRLKAQAAVNVELPPVPAAPVKLEIRKTVNQSNVRTGEAVTYSIVVSNIGGSSAENIQLEDVLPAGVSGTDLRQSFNLNAGESKTFTVPVTVTSNTSGSIINTASINWNGARQQSSATIQVTAPQPAKLELLKTVDRDFVRAGDTATYTITVTNTGETTAQNIKLSDALPTGVMGTNLNAEFNLAPGQQKVFKLPVVVANNATGTIVNTANLNWNNTTLSSSASIRVQPPAMGLLNVNAIATTCGTRTPLQNIAYSINGVNYVTGSNIKLAPGTYTVVPAELNGSSSQAISVVVNENTTSNATLEYAVQIELVLDPSELDLVAGETETITASAFTDFPYAVPASLNLSLPSTVQVLGATAITGTISSDSALELAVQVRALKASNSTITATLSNTCATAETSLSITAKPLPDQRRESQVVLLSRVTQIPANSRVILSDRIPSNASYIPGSSRVLNTPSFNVNIPANSLGEAIPDPYISGDRLFWVIPEKAYQQILRAKNIKTNTIMNAAQTRSIFGITYKLSHTDILEMPKDRIAVILASPNTRSAASERTAMLDPTSSIGRELGNAELRVIVGDPSILNLIALARPTNAANTSNDAVGGAAAVVRITAIRATTEPADQPQLLIQAFDSDGKPANDPYATIALNVEPRTIDANPDQTGYQVKLVNGVGRIELRNIDGDAGNENPVETLIVEARITNQNGTISSSQSFKTSDLKALALDPDNQPVNASPRPLVAVGLASAQVNIDLSSGAFSIEAGLRGYAKGTVFEGGVLTLAVNWIADWDQTGGLVLSGDLLPPANPFVRFPVTGDASSAGSDVRSSEGIYAKLEFGSSYALYGQFSPNFTGVLTGYGRNFNGLQGVYRAGVVQVNTFGALVANANISNTFPADGTSLYRLDYSDITTSSERVVVSVFDKNNPSIKLSERVLVRIRDYEIDYVSGLIQLRRPLNSTDLNGNPQSLNVEYATNAAGVPRELRFGVQASLEVIDGLILNATALQFRPGTALKPNADYLFGIGASYKSGGFQIGFETAFSGTPGANTGGLGFAAQTSYTQDAFQFQARYQDTTLNYLNPQSGTEQQGRNLDARVSYGQAKDFNIGANFLWNQNYQTGANSSQISANANKDFGGFSANVGLSLQIAQASALATSTTALFGTFGAQIPLGAFKLGLLQRVPFFGSKTTYGDTNLSIEYAITENFGIRLSEVLTYEPNGIRQNWSLSTRGTFTNAEILRVLGGNTLEIPDTFGTTNISASYELDNLSGDAGRARVGLDTTIPLGGNWSAQLGGEANFIPLAGTNASLALGALYNSKETQASARVQLSFQPTGIKQIYTAAAVFRSSDNLIISPSIEYDVLPSFVTLTNGSSVRDGGRYSIAAAWRAERLSILTNNTGRFGIYAPKGDEIQGEIQFGYAADERLFIRAGAAYLVAGGTFTGQLSAGATYFLTDTFGLGANTAFKFQPATGVNGMSFGVEASYRVLNGFVLSAGFNFLGFSGIGGFTQPGLYIRFDWKFDERTFGR